MTGLQSFMIGAKMTVDCDSLCDGFVLPAGLVRIHIACLFPKK